MAALVKTELIEELRRLLDEVTLSGEIASVDTDLEDLASSNFSDTDLGERLDDAARYCAARVRAKYIPELITNIETTDVPNTKILRFLGSRVFVVGSDTETRIATRRTMQGHRKMEATGVVSSEENPVYIIEDFEARIVPDALDGSSTLDVVVVPTDCEDLNHRLRVPVVQRALYMCFQTLRLRDQAAGAKAAYAMALQPLLLPVKKLGVQ
jgi:hypothetical protein